MRYIVKRETTGKVGRCEFDHSVTLLRDFSTHDEALAMMKARRQLFLGTRYTVKLFGSDTDFYVIFCSKELDCIERYWIEKENPGPHLPWWME